ncbi:cytochrome P450, partial [Ceratobasidium sp. AG-I]
LRNVDIPHSPTCAIGHLHDIFSPAGLPFHDNLQDTYGSVSKVKGLFGSDELYISDPRVIHEILVKEHETAQADNCSSINNLSFGPGLLATLGEVHKAQRKMLNPVFTAKHMKALMHRFVETDLPPLKAAIINDIGDASCKDLDMLKWCSTTALELIGQAGDVIRRDTYSRTANFRPALFALFPYRFLMPLVYNLRPAGLRRKIVEWTPDPNVQRLKEIIDIQDEQAQAILNEKKANLHTDQGEASNDIMSILLRANMNTAEQNRLPEDQLLGQMNTLIFAGHETTSGALARVLHLLSLNPVIQDHLRGELNAAPPSVDYNELHSLEYLDAVCREVLRLYPPVTTIERQALKDSDSVIPLRYPVKGKDGKELREIGIKKGTIIYVALREANRCKQTWGEDADDFKPERWLGNLPSSVSDAKTSGVYSSMMTFSAGPRACIGFKFSLLELKIVLSMLVKSFKFAPASVPVQWCLGTTMVPYESGTAQESKRPGLPLNVSAA